MCLVFNVFLVGWSYGGFEFCFDFVEFGGGDLWCYCVVEGDVYFLVFVYCYWCDVCDW